MKDIVNIAGRAVGSGKPCFVIAEAGVNHNGSLDEALRLVEAAQAAGADAVKFQLFRAEEQVSSATPTAEYQKDQTGADNMLEMAQSYDLPWEAHRRIAEHCRACGIAYMSSCFDREAVDFLMRELDGDAIKVGSGEITNFPLLAYMAKTGKPILLSTGMCTLSDVAQAVDHIQASGPSPLVLFQCVSSYPTEPAAVNLRAMQLMEQAFHVPIAFSDHTLGSTAAIAAVALGACMVEKHFTRDKTQSGPDHAMALDPQELRDFVQALRDAQAALGDGIKRPHESEIAVRDVARRSLVSRGPIRRGERLDDGNVTLKRPATGIDPRLWDAVRGRTAAQDIPADVPIRWEMLG